jgi:hypothetical protein
MPHCDMSVATPLIASSQHTNTAQHMDGLFFLPPSPAAMPRAYWLPQRGVLASAPIVLPHHRYFLLSAEFRNKDHCKYLGSNAPWDGEKALKEAKHVHLSDWPASKPWLQPLNSMLASHVMPACAEANNGGKPDCTDHCTDQRLWRWLYSDFRKRRQVSAVLGWHECGVLTAL